MKNKVENKSNLIIGILGAIVLALPYRKGWAANGITKKESIVTNIIISIVTTLSLMFFSYSNSNYWDD